MLKAYGENIIVKRLGSDKKNSSGVVKTSSNKEKPLEVVVEKSLVTKAPEGKHFLIARYSGMEIDHEGESLLIITTDDIIAEVSDD